MLRRRVGFVASLLISVVFLLMTLLAAELVFRTLLFSELSFMRALKEPAKYANEYCADYFKLQHAFTEKCFAASDKSMGWIDAEKMSATATGDYRHVDDSLIGERTPVLFYGDSFT